MRGAGFLAIWSDVEAHDLTDYRHWLTREHTTERVTTKGFRGVRVFRAARDDINRFFILYELEAPEVLDGEAYLARLNAPTPWSQRIMPKLGNFMRGGGVMIARAGRGGHDHGAARREIARNSCGIGAGDRRVRRDRRRADRSDRRGADIGADR
jgi:hypothetical protein